MSKIILGTAKFGTSNYGFSSKNKRISSFQILKLANELGIDTLDYLAQIWDCRKNYWSVSQREQKEIQYLYKNR